MAENNRLEAGDRAPAFNLPDQDGNKVKLTDYKGKWLVLYFYPKDDTPGCTIEANEFTEILKKFDKLNAGVIGVSPDSPESHRKFIDKYNLKLTLLSDAEREVLEKYGAYGTKKMYGKETKGVIRSTFLIDPSGKIAQSWYNVRAKGHAEKVHDRLAEAG